METCHDILDDDGAEQGEFLKLAERSANEKLLQLCKVSFFFLKCKWNELHLLMV